MGNNRSRRLQRGICLTGVLSVILVITATGDQPRLEAEPITRAEGRSLTAPLALDTWPQGADSLTTMDENPSAGQAVIHTIGKKIVNRGRFSGPVPRFEQRDIDERTAGEPMVVFDRDGDAFYSSMIGREATFGFRTVVLKSTDNGGTWSDVSPLDPTSANMYMTFDPYVHVDPVTGRLFSVDWVRDARGTPPYQCLHVASTDDGGATWQQSPFCPGGDHQTLWTGPPAAIETKSYPNVVYLYSNFCGWESWPSYVDNESCFVRSLDGGVSWSEPVSIFRPGCGPEAGHSTASWADGTIYIPRVTCEFPGWERPPESKKDIAPRAEVAVSHDNGTTWDVVVVDDKWLREDPSGGNASFQHEARVAVDAAGNAYFLFTDHKGMPRLSISRDQGRTWSRSIHVAAPRVKDTNSNFIGIAAGEPGKIAFTYLGTPGKGDSDEQVWNQYVGISLNALAKKPVIATTTTNLPDNPLKRGECRDRCPGTNGSWGMMDFFNIEINPATGMVWTSLVDICTMTCDGPGGTSDYEGNQGGVGVQVAGPRLGTNLP